jgi:uncharacterized protein (TIGR02246 family)
MRALIASFSILVLVSAGIVRVQPARSDEAEARTFVEAYQNALNSHDPSAIAAFFTQDADLVVRNGPAIRGRQAIEKFWSAYFAGRPSGTTSTPTESSERASFAIDSIRSITSDVVLIDMTARGLLRNSEGKDVTTREGRGTFVLVRQDGKWLISALRVLPTERDRIIFGTAAR